MQPGSGYPVRVVGRLDAPLSRWLWLVKWLLAIPHYLILIVLWTAFWPLTLIALIAILITTRYPRPLFDFNLGVLRWTWRVAYYTYAALGTDHYPPFTLTEAPHYPATLHLPYPTHLSRGLALTKWWLLALPHYLLLTLVLGTAPTLLGLLVLYAALTLLATGRYPTGLHHLILGINRWALRVTAYATLMTDRYPPFRLDQGPTDPTPPAGGVHREAGAPAGAEQPVREGRPTPTGGESHLVLRPAREPLPGWAIALIGVAATAVLGAAVWSAAHLHPDHTLRTGALFVHLAALVVGFGAVIAVDWFALLWLLGRRSLGQLTNVASAAHLPIWVGLATLVLSGALCQPNLTLRLTWVKLGLVLLVMLNGLYAYALGERLARAAAGAMPRGLLRHAAGVATVSQLGWWGAVIIGFVNTQ